MTIKRKQAPNTGSEPPAKRQTRSSGPLVETQAAGSARRSARSLGTPKGIAQIPSIKPSVAAKPTKSRAKRHGRETSNSSLKENQLESSEESSEDELNLSPSKARPATPSSTSGSSRVMEVVITRRRPEGSRSAPQKRAKSLDPLPETPVKSRKLVTYTSRDKKKMAQTFADSLLSETSPIASGSKRPTVATVTTTSSKTTTFISPSEEPSQVVRTPIVSPSKQLAVPSTPSSSRPTSSPAKHLASTTPFKKSGASALQASPSRLVRALPPHLHSCLNAQKRAVLHALQNPPDTDVASEEEDDEGPSTSSIAIRQLGDLLEGTVNRGEGNSCLLLGPRGSGKTRVSNIRL
jgi:origin recognition complex subunit 4